MKLSPHFSYSELITTSKPHLQDEPSQEVITNACVLAAATLEPLRSYCGRLRVNSWYRSAALNKAVGGSKKSDHLTGCGVDIRPLDMERMAVWGELVFRALWELPLTQAIVYEDTGHIHVALDRFDPYGRPSLLVKLAGGRYVDWKNYNGRLREGRVGT